jgi:NAD+ kinase
VKKILIYARYVKEEYEEPFMIVLTIAKQKGYKVAIIEDLHDHMSKKIGLDGISKIRTQQEIRSAKIDTVITLGGDGTILGAASLIGELEIPIFGINLGRLGFLANVDRNMISEALDKVDKGHYRIEERSMIYLESDPNVFGDTNYALNDFTMHKRDTSSMITIHTYVNGDYLNSYWADGIIVATPTGSTGYSLSCGGPIIFPGSNTFVITPVAPHNLNVRPLVISDSSIISFEIEGRAKNFLCSLDSRYELITAKHQLAVRKCNFVTKLIVLNGQSFLSTIHEKLYWGSDQRN